jgi:O-antigen ligase
MGSLRPIAALPPTGVVVGAGLVVGGSGVAGAAIGAGHPAAAVAVVVLALAPPALAVLAGPWRCALVFATFAIGIVGDPLDARLPLPFGFGVWLADLILAAALGGWLLEWLLSPTRGRPVLPRTPVLGVAYLAFVATLVIGAWRGHERYGATLIGMPLKLAAYAGLVTAMTALTPRRALASLTVTLYGTSVFAALLAAYHVATGTSSTAYLDLSTGGIRYVGVNPATFAAAAVLLALVNLAGRPTRPSLHLAGLMLSGFVVVVAYTRSVYLALALVLLVGLAGSPRLRSATLRSMPILVPVALIAMLLAARAAPDLPSTLVERVTSPAATDSSVEWRARAYKTVLAGVREEPVLGVGFGRKTSFSLGGMPNVIEGDPHNGFIYVYAGGGLLALTALVVLLGVFLADAGRRWRRADFDGRMLIAWAVASWCVFMLHAASEPMFTEPATISAIWVLMLLPALAGAPRGPAQGRVALPPGRSERRREPNGSSSRSSPSKVRSAATRPR